MIIAYVLMALLIFVSVGYLLKVLSRASNETQIDPQTQHECAIQDSILEEEQRGRLSQEERERLLLDLEYENGLQIQLKSRPKATKPKTLLAIWLTALVFIVLGSTVMYQHLGYSKEVVFHQQLEANRLTPEAVRDFIQYRSRRYDRAADWYYEATDFMSTEDYPLAVAAFEQALKKLPANDEGRITLMAEYAQAIFYAQDNQTSPKLEKIVEDILQQEPTQAMALGLKGVIEFDQKKYLAAVLAWQEAIRYNANSMERLALLSGIKTARELGGISYQTAPAIITDSLLVNLDWDPQEIQWHEQDVLLVYALAEGEKMPIAIQRVMASEADKPILLTNLDTLMPTVSLADVENVDLVVKLSNLNEKDLTKGQIIGIKSHVKPNSKQIFVIKLGL